MDSLLLAVTLFVAYPVTMLFILQSFNVYTRFPNVATAMFFPTQKTPGEFSKLFFLPCMMMFFIISLAFGSQFRNFTAVTGFAVIFMSLLPNLLFPIISRIFKINSKNIDHHYAVLAFTVTAIGFIVVGFCTISTYNFEQFEIISRISVLSAMVLHAVFSLFRYHDRNSN